MKQARLAEKERPLPAGCKTDIQKTLGRAMEFNRPEEAKFNWGRSFLFMCVWQTKKNLRCTNPSTPPSPGHISLNLAKTPFLRIGSSPPSRVEGSVERGILASAR